jgi:hypothetical protein
MLAARLASSTLQKFRISRGDPCVACAAPTDYRFLIFCRSRAAGFSSTVVNQFHERVLPATAPLGTIGAVMPLVDNRRPPSAVANF